MSVLLLGGARGLRGGRGVLLLPVGQGGGGAGDGGLVGGGGGGETWLLGRGGQGCQGCKTKAK